MNSTAADAAGLQSRGERMSAAMTFDDLRAATSRCWHHPIVKAIVCVVVSVACHFLVP